MPKIDPAARCVRESLSVPAASVLGCNKIYASLGNARPESAAAENENCAGGAWQCCPPVVVRGDLSWTLGESALKQYLTEDDGRAVEHGSPLVRLAVVGAPGDQQYFVFTAHHSVYDGWSWTRLFDAATSLYHEPESVVSSPPFTRFIRQLGDSDRAEEAKSFWRSELGGEEMPAPFPARPKLLLHQPNLTQTITHEIKAPLVTGMVTMAALLRAAWALVVSPHTGDDSVMLGTILAGRTAPVRGILDMLAPTLTTVPVRIRVNRSQSVAEYLDAIQQQAVSMMPFGKCLRMLKSLCLLS